MKELTQAAFAEASLELVEPRDEKQVVEFEATVKVGDIVYLKSGTPKYTLRAIRRGEGSIEDTEVTISWSSCSGNTVGTKMFFSAQLSTDPNLEMR